MANVYEVAKAAPINRIIIIIIFIIIIVIVMSFHLMFQTQQCE